MTFDIVGIVLLAALLHALWNMLVKRDANPLRAVVFFSAGGAVICAPLLFFVPPLPPAAWEWILISTLMHAVYKYSLARAYKTGDFGEVYPIARGFAPCLSALGAFIVFAETPSPLQIAAIVLITFGIASFGNFAKGFTGGRGFALLTACAIATYTLCDAVGVRISGNALTYIVVLGVCDGAFMSATALLLRRVSLDEMRNIAHWRRGLLTGAMGLAAYGLVLWAFVYAPVGLVATLRETSVAMAAFIAIVFLKEPAARRKFIAGILITSGVALMQIV